MKYKHEIFLVKYILISLLVFSFYGCTKEVAYNTLENVSKNNCRSILNAQERFECENKHSNYKDYKKYYEKNE